MSEMRNARKGDISTVYPDLFPTDWPKPIIANIMEVAAHDVSEMLSQLPSINCSSGQMTSESARKFADKKTQIAYSYVAESRLPVNLYSGTDQFATYGFMPIIVEPDYEAQMPKIRIDDPFGAYPEYDRWGQLTKYVRRYMKTVDELCALFPEHSVQIRTNPALGRPDSGNTKLEMIHYIDKDTSCMYLPERKNHCVSQVKNRLSRIPVVCPKRPGLDPEDMTGEFDQILWVWIARARFALLSLEAATKAVEAPIAVPEDTEDFALGGDNLMRMRDPSQVRRVPLEMPQSAFAQENVLEREARVGARFPESRTGSMDASVITGRGVQELNGGFDGRIRAYQTLLAEAIGDAITIAFEMDEAYWGGKEKNVRGTRNGAPYEVKYKPSKDIAGDYTVDVQYGLMAGLDPNRAMVFGLQARGDGLISRDFLRRQMPWELDVTQEEQRIDIEELRDYLMQGIAGTIQAMPIMAQMGADPSDIVTKVAQLIEARRKGTAIEEAAAKIFVPPEPPPSPEIPGEAPLPGPEDQTGAGGGQLPPGMGPDGLMRGVAPGQAGMSPGGRPDMRNLLAGLTSGGQPNLTANVVRRQPV